MKHFFRQLYRSVVDNRKQEFLELNRYMAKRVPVDFDEAFPLGSAKWTVSNLLSEIKAAASELGLARLQLDVDATWIR